MRVDRERHTHLANRESKRFPGLELRISIKHLDLTFITKVYLSLIGDRRIEIATDVHTRIADLETSFLVLHLVFVLAAERSANLHTLQELLPKSVDSNKQKEES